MKKLFVIISVLLSVQLLHSQERTNEEVKTLFNGDMAYSGWFVGIPINYTQIDKKERLLPGFQAGISLGRKLYLGFKGQSLSNYPNQNKYTDKFPEVCYLEGGYGGLLIEPIFFHNKVVHFTLPIVIGGGHALYRSESIYPEIDDDGEFDLDSRILDNSGFIALEAGINAEVNVFKYMKLAAGVSYRHFGGLELVNTKEDALCGINGNLVLKFGKF